MSKEILTILASVLLMASVITSPIITRTLIQPGSLALAYGSLEEDIDTNVECSNGTLGTDHSGLTLWYAWMNTSGSQVIFLAYQSYVLNPPVITFLGQHYFAEDGAEVFVGNTLEAMELYNDTNGNGLPDADFTSGQSEILYSFFVNSSTSFDIKPINKIVIEGLPHYQWGIRYRTIDGFLDSADDQFTAAMVTVDYMDFSYDFYVQDSVTYLKTNFGLGQILQTVPLGDGNVSLNGLSVALFYGTIIITSRPYTTIVNDSPYNSSTAPASVEPMSLSEIRIADAAAYEFLFGQNYTLLVDSALEVYESKCTAVSDQSVSEGTTRSEWLLSTLEETLANIFPKISSMEAAIDLDYNVSSFLYRVCYPTWNGYQLSHDPTFIAYLNPLLIPELNFSLLFVIVTAVASTTALVIVWIGLKKNGRALKGLDPNRAFLAYLFCVAFG